MAINVKSAAVPSDVDKHLTPAKFTNKPITTTVTTEKLVAGKVVATSEKQEVVAPAGFIPPYELVHVMVNGSRSINLGNYESAKFTVGISLPCTHDTKNEAYDYACEWINERMEATVNDLEANKKKD